MEIIGKNRWVGIGIDPGIEPMPAESPFNCRMKYRSVIAFGTCRVLSGPAEKKNALKNMSEHYGVNREEVPDFSPDGVDVFSN